MASVIHIPHVDNKCRCYILGMFYGLEAMCYAFPSTELTGTIVTGIWLVLVFRKLNLFAS